METNLQGANSPVHRPPQDTCEAILAILVKLQESLLGSGKALIALDLAGIEQGTREQMALSKQLGLCLQATKSRTESSAHASSGEASSAGASEPSPATDDEYELQQAIRDTAVRVLERTHLQSALLARSRRKLRVMANFLAGLERSYEAC